MKKINVLIIDCVDDIRTCTELALKHEDTRYEVHCAECGMDGIESIHRIKPDVVLLEVMLHDIDGWEIKEMIKNDPECKNIKVIMFTSKHDEIKKKNGHKFDGFIKKPYDIKDIDALIKKVIKKK